MSENADAISLPPPEPLEDPTSPRHESQRQRAYRQSFRQAHEDEWESFCDRRAVQEGRPLIAR